jgi:hypothetical protein
MLQAIRHASTANVWAASGGTEKRIGRKSFL